MADDQEQTPVENAELNPAEGQGQPKPRMGFLPKLVLWSLVLLFGFLYLGSLERKPGAPFVPFSMGGGDQEAPAVAAPVASDVAGETARAVPSAPPAQKQQPAIASEPKSPAEASAPSATAPDVSKQEAEAFARAVMTKKSESTATTAPAPAAVATPAPAAKQAAQSPSSQAPATAAPTSVGAEAAETAVSADDADAPVSASDWAAKRRAEAEAYYAEQRRRAEAAARQRWEAMQRRAPAPWQAAPPAAMPYGAYGRWPAPAAPGYYQRPAVPGASSSN